MTNLFDDEDGQFLALINDEGQYSLWPAVIEVPAGWRVVLTARSRQECVDHIDQNWVDMRPKSLIDAVSEA